jgi:hypothetical protein
LAAASYSCAKLAAIIYTDSASTFINSVTGSRFTHTLVTRVAISTCWAAASYNCAKMAAIIYTHGASTGINSVTRWANALP